MFGMVALIFTVAMCMFVTRLIGVQKRTVRYSYFKVMQGKDPVPDAILRTGRNFVNQFELPVLFFVVCILLLVLKKTDDLFVLLAWLFVASRAVHATIHMTYNNVTHRLSAFLVGVVLLNTLWIRLALQLWCQGGSL